MCCSGSCRPSNSELGKLRYLLVSIDGSEREISSVAAIFISSDTVHVVKCAKCPVIVLPEKCG